MRKITVVVVVLSFLFCGTIFGAEGDVLWTRTYNGVDDSNDHGYGIAVDGDGNVYVTGYETVTGEMSNIWVRKYDSSGNVEWTRTYNGPGNKADTGMGIAVDGSGNVYVTGYEYLIAESYNIWVRKYNSNGEEVWTKTYNGASSDVDCGYGIAVDGNGNVYVAGYETVTGEWANIWVRKCDPDGEEIWTKTHNGPDNGSDRAYAIAVDGRGNVYVTGYEDRGAPNEDDIWVRKYNSNGGEVWTKTHNGSGDDDDEGAGIAVDGMGNVYVTGSEVVTGEGRNIWVRKYNSNGDELWTRTHNGAENTEDRGYAIAVDGSGNLFVTGFERATATESDNIWVRKYDSSGNVVWTKTYNGSDSFDEGHGIALDESGNIYVAGFEFVTGEGYNIWVRKYEGAFGVHFGPPEEGEVKIQGGEEGYVNPKKGEVAKIHFQPSGSGVVKVKIYTLRGLLVWEGTKSVSGYQDFINWNCRNEDGDIVASGIYIVYVEGPGIKEKRKVAILK